MTTIIDSGFFRKNWSVPALEKVFSDEGRIQSWLDVEAALARVQGRLGVIPADAAREIDAHCRVDRIDLNLFKDTLAKTGHMIMPVLKCVQAACPGKLGEFVHYGATTQDIMDTGEILQIRQASRYILKEALRLEKAILEKAKKFQYTVMAGRTHGQQGLPITMGFKFATWAAELRRDIERIKAFPDRVFVLMLFGAVGSKAGYGSKAAETVEGVGKELGLKVLPICWATSRDVLAEYLSTLGILAGTIGRIANEVIACSTSEVGELREPMSSTTVGSSTMPHKRNPAACETIVAQCRIVQSYACLGMQTQISEHERDPRMWRIDLVDIPNASMLAARAVTSAADVVEGLEVHQKNIERNLNLLGGLLLSEAVMLVLGQKIGKNTAHHLLHELALDQSVDRTFVERLHDCKQVTDALTHEEIDAIFDYSKYLGQAPADVDAVIAYCARLAQTDPDPERF